MKLAREIAGKIEELNMSVDYECPEKTKLIASIIAVYLYPVREALKSIEYLVITDDIALSYVRPSLALFEEDS